eukprot:c18638_g1_i1.p1 GENE.c18638_g1_i1~~c18638_g1_i1.p1  ORF type:complete len:464 (+),score=101.84 c18638_g1_i1:103-1392(+)
MKETPSLSTPLLSLKDAGLLKTVKHQFRPGSMLGSVFNLCSATLGAGALSLPFAFSRSGLALGIALLAVGGIATSFSIKLLIRARLQTNLKSYEELSAGLFGRTMSIATELNIFLFCFGTAVAYCRAVGDILAPVIDVLHAPSWLNERVAMAGFWAAVMFPLSLFKSMNALQFSSLFGVLTILYLVLATTIHSIEDGAFDQTDWAETKLWVGTPSGVLQAAPIVIFAFACQVNVFAIYDELEMASKERMSKVTRRSIGVCMTIYILMGMFGVLDYHSDTCGNILRNFREDLEHRNILVIAAYLCITLTIIAAYPLVIFPCRFTIEVVLDRLRWRDSRIRHVVLTLVLSGLSLLLSLFIKNISVVFQLVGGTTSAFVCFVLPSVYAIRLKLTTSLTEKILVWVLAIGGSLVGIASTALTIHDLIRPSTTC